jgi:hypothetical protein
VTGQLSDRGDSRRVAGLPQEVIDQIVADRCQHAFRVELHTLDRMLVVTNPHHELLTVVVSRRRYLEAVGYVGGDQRVIPPGLKPLLNVGKHTLAVVIHRVGLSVRRRGRMADAATVLVGRGFKP